MTECHVPQVEKKMFEVATGKPQYFCHHCHKEVFLDSKPGRRDECSHCGSELHVCLNCELYDARLTRGCREPQAEEVRDKARANFCDWFSYRPGKPAGEGPSEADKAKAAFASLFKK
jgi:DNA-directed RNA polymerase subunit RPC12/RpoP